VKWTWSQIGIDENAKVGRLSTRIGLSWAKSHVFTTGQCPVMKYDRQLMQAILHDKIHIAEAVGVEVIRLDAAPAPTKTLTRARPRDSCWIRTVWFPR
jgi:threonine dehydrogenase-like Zn-dependent dehydrogenase